MGGGSRGLYCNYHVPPPPPPPPPSPPLPSPPLQVSVDEEVCVMTTEMLQVLLKCFSALTGGGKVDKISIVVR